ncbi:heterokaryon incompatibility, partial [Halenospora varia]
KTRPLLIDGKIIYITASLDDALRQLLSLGFTTIPFWIDAVCINQNDDVEKSWQVQQMMRIYKRADFVLVWLSPEPDDSDIAVDAIKVL